MTSGKDVKSACAVTGELEVRAGRIKVGRWLGGETSASEQKGEMQWTGTLLRNVACFRLFFFFFSLVFDLGQGLRNLRYDVVCTLETEAVTELWRLELFSCTSSLFLCAGTLSSERQMLLFFAGGLVGVHKHLFQRVSFITSMTLRLNIIFSFCYSPMSMLYGVHLRTKIIENKIQFEVQKLDYPCRNLVV